MYLLFNYLKNLSSKVFGTAKPEEDKYHLTFLKSCSLFLTTLCNFFFLYQRTPLHIATKEGHEITVKSLVDKGANINIQDKAGVSMKILLKV